MPGSTCRLAGGPPASSRSCRVPEFRDLQCPLRGTGLSHIQDTRKRPDGSCIFCQVAITWNPDAIPADRGTFTDDDRIGPQIPWEEEQCPARGPALPHYLPDRVAGACMHCHHPVVHRLDHELIFERESAQPDYAETMRLHTKNAMIAFRAQRPIASAKHAQAARVLMRAHVAERNNPEPDLLVD